MGLKNMGLVLGFLGFLFVIGPILCMADIHYYDFVLQESNFTRLCETKSMLTVNDSFPGPVIHVQKGDTVFVNVHNQGKYGVTIHWHGVRQPRNPWSDGPEYITQCPIKPGSNFTQEIIFSTEEGTLWWHAHSDWSRATVHGAMIIKPPTGKAYPFPQPDVEQVIVLASWFKEDLMEILEVANSTGAPPQEAEAFTINGQPGDQYNCSADSMYRLSVEYNKTYLLRIISSVMNEALFFGIAGHNITVVGSDAAYIKPINTDYIMITPGQTMDVLFTANQSPSHYYMLGSVYFSGPAPPDAINTTAVVQYTGNYTAPSTPAVPTLPAETDGDAVMNFTKRMKSLATTDYPINVPTTIDTQIFMTVSVNQIVCPKAPNGSNTCSGPDGNRPSASLNNISFANPSIDILQAYYRNISGIFESDFPNKPPFLFNFTGDNLNVTSVSDIGTKAKVIKHNATVEIVFQGTNLGAGAENHPMHLHGFSFYLVGMGFGNFSNTTGPQTYNLDDPPEVNTFGLPKNGWATIRFVADNPGMNTHTHTLSLSLSLLI
uniref:Laccase n=1 Tax=Davidia involucrata TaxID=16924 RepID=A0A5B6ZWP8_DAVIN